MSNNELNQLDRLIRENRGSVPEAPAHLKHQIRAEILKLEEKPSWMSFLSLRFAVPAMLVLLVAMVSILRTPTFKTAQVSDEELEIYLEETFSGVMDSVNDEEWDFSELSLK